MSLDFRQCDDCGMCFPQKAESCPGCGRFALTLRELFIGPRLPATGGLPLLAVVLALIAPSPWESVLLGTGFAPLVATLTWLLWRRGRRNEECFALRARALEARLTELEHDLEDTDARLVAAEEDLEEETGERAALMLQQELTQDRRLQGAQRRMVSQLQQRLERLEVERFRTELGYYEACRDARIDSLELAETLATRIETMEKDEGRGRRDAWGQVMEDAWLLQRQLARGVQRLHAARRLDPLTHADTAGEVDAPPALEEGELEVETDLQLERIERSLAALDELADELASDLVRDPDTSGVRLRVDDEVLAALEDSEIEIEREMGERTSVV